MGLPSRRQKFSISILEEIKMTTIIDGKTAAQNINIRTAGFACSLSQRGVTPGLAVILVGGDPASAKYVSIKHKLCEKLGIYSEVLALGETTTQEELETAISGLADRDEIDGILLQLPLPKGLDKRAAIALIPPGKDVDGLTETNMGALMLGTPKIIPCTPRGVMELIDIAGIAVTGEHAVIVGRSELVGKPLGALLISRNATVTLCHSYSKNLKKITKSADILVAAMGKPGFITDDYIKQGAAVIDVGTTEINGTLYGDVAMTKQSAGYLTPVPGGVGPMTVAMLMRNTVECARRRLSD